MQHWTNTVSELAVDAKFIQWLTKPKILSKALRQHCTNLTVQVLQQQIAAARNDEQQILEINEANSWIREVYLCGDGTPWVLARTVVPYLTYIKYQQQFNNLDTRLLGEAFLYLQADIVRTAFSYSLLDGRPARRSVFRFGDAQLLVTESFLAAIPNMH